MSRNTISTGLDHQRDVALWARRRLVDASGGCFRTGRARIEQYGVIFADGVGLGKTWEALAASALVLDKMSKERQGGGRRQTLRRRSARVLVLCPPGLVSKWSREVRDPRGFSVHLKKWAAGRRRRAYVLDTLTEPFEIRRRSNLKDLPAGTMRRSRVELPAGTYVCNWNVLRKKVGSGRSRLAALRSQPWDILIVDEAHHREAREAIDTVQSRARRIRATLLLTATPFQLDPREIHQLFAKILDRRHKEHLVLSRPPVQKLVKALADFFDRGGEAPRRSLKRAAEQILQQAIVRSKVRSRGRRYYLINEVGTAREIAAPERMQEGQLQAQLPSSIAPSREFETWYLQRRLQLADGKRTFIPNKLRQALSTPAQARSAGPRGDGPPRSPRLDALAAWAGGQIEHDLLRTAGDGYPRKILVFTSFVGRAARELRDALTKATDEAWAKVRNRRAWRSLAKEAPRGIERVAKTIERLVKRDEVLKRSPDAQHLVQALWKLARSADESLVTDMFGSRRFRGLVRDDLKRRLDALAAVLRGDRARGWWTPLHWEERRSLRATIRALVRVASVATYTGHDDRKEREAAGEAFRSPLAPWILVASNVGSEGIDLQTYSAHLVHFDIEWNPARMEQREGRSDRVGRLLREPVNIYYVLVRGTYDERMLHQLVARQRWHSVLLGRPGARLVRDRAGRIDARVLDVEDARKLALDLRPAPNR